MWSGQCKLHQRREHQALLATLPILEHCICGQHLTVKRALICTCGGFPSICHNELRDMHGWDPHWSVSQCRNWATTSTTHRWTPYTWISKQGGWGPSRHCSWQVLGKRPEPCHFWHKCVQPLRAESPKYLPQSVLQEKQNKSIWSTCQRSGAWSSQHQEEWDQQPMWSTREYPQWLPRNMTRHIARPSIASDENWATDSCAQQLCA